MSSDYIGVLSVSESDFKSHNSGEWESGKIDDFVFYHYSVGLKPLGGLILRSNMNPVELLLGRIIVL